MMYELCKMQIKNGGDKAYMMTCLGCFLMTKQITQEQYIELMAMLNPTPTTPTPTGTVSSAPTVQGQIEQPQQ